MIEHEVVELFVLQSNNVLVQPNPDEVMDLRWESLNDLYERINNEPCLLYTSPSPRDDT